MSTGESIEEGTGVDQPSTTTAAMNIGTVVAAVSPGWFFMGTLGLALHRQLGFSEIVIGVLAASGSVGYVAVALPAGRSVDRSGGNWMFTRAPFAVGLGFGLMTLVHSEVAFAVIAFVLGAVYAGATAALNRYALLVARNGRSGLTIGLVQASAMMVACVGALVLPWLANAHGWRCAVLVLGIVCTVASVFAAIQFRGDRRIPVPPPSPVARGSRHLDRRFRALVCFGFAMGIAMTCTWTFLLPYLATTVGLSTTASAIGLALLFASAITGRLVGGLILDRGIGAPLLLLVSATSGVCSFVVLALVRRGPFLYVAVAALGLLLLAHNTAFLLAGLRMVSRETWAFAGAALTMSQVVGGIVGPLAFGVLVVRFGGYRTSWLVVSATTLVGLLALRIAFPTISSEKGARK